ncbi:MAG TPA: long-chain fatty acid--CoA ligase [Actinomycetota bacterium]|nr:long-chain fatty acid--CoA ligase [Actinomycetota bacterium]
MSRDVAAERADIDATVEGKTITSLFQQTVSEHAEIPALKWKEGEDWKSLSWAEYGRLVTEMANGLISLGLRKGEFANILSSNRYEYYIADLATMHAGGIPVSLYNTLAPEQIEYIVNHCEAVFVFVENRDFYEKLLKIRQQIPNVRKVVMFEGAEEFADDEWVISYDEVLEAGREFAKTDAGELEQRWKAITPEDLATLIYTSGTTGPPKGVMITHYNVVWTMESLKRMLPEFPAGMRQISYLPLAHIAERMTGLYNPIYHGSTVHFCPDPRQVAAYLGQVKPQFFFGVPRVWEKLHAGLSGMVNNNPDEAQRKQAQEAIEACLEKVRLEQAGQPVPEDLQRKVEEAEAITGFLRMMVGMDELIGAASGAAPIAREVLEWLHAVGIKVSEVYGQSEDTGPTSFNRMDSNRLGTVGPALPGVEVRLAEDGEVLVRGGNVTQGYYKEPEMTRETFDEDGWLHSGDIGEFDEDGYLSIVDRKKEIIITAGGKNIAPSNVENLLKGCPIVGQAAVIGDRRKYVTALVVLDAEAAPAWAAKEGLPTDIAELAEHPRVHEMIQSYIDEMNTKLHSQEQVKRFTVLPTEWTAESEELTPTLKLKRRVIESKYEREIEGMYA